MGSIIRYFIVVMLGATFPYLQIYLSKKKSKWLGLILPTISILFPVFLILITNSHKHQPANEIFKFIMIGVVEACFLLVIYIHQRFKKRKT